MAEHEWLAERFEENRTHLRAVAYRMLGSLSEADDAVQQGWLRLSRSDISGVENLGGWLTTVVARVCLDMLRSRKSRREEPLGEHVPEPIDRREGGIDPEHEALLADSVGLALLVVLETLASAERGRARAARHVRSPLRRDRLHRRALPCRGKTAREPRTPPGVGAAAPDADVTCQREVVDAFLAALRGADFDALVAVLDPDVVVRVDQAAGPPGTPREVRGARTWAKGALAYSRFAHFAQPALVNGAVGVVVAPRGRLFRVLNFTLTRGKIAQVDVIADPARLRQLHLAVLPEARLEAGK
jgi:RNA polymerase sigma-70 factor, ECF subfamily